MTTPVLPWSHCPHCLTSVTVPCPRTCRTRTPRRVRGVLKAVAWASVLTLTQCAPVGVMLQAVGSGQSQPRYQQQYQSAEQCIDGCITSRSHCLHYRCETEYQACVGRCR